MQIARINTESQVGFRIKKIRFLVRVVVDFASSIFSTSSEYVRLTKTNLSYLAHNIRDFSLNFFLFIASSRKCDL